MKLNGKSTDDFYKRQMCVANEKSMKMKLKLNEKEDQRRK